MKNEILEGLKQKEKSYNLEEGILENAFITHVENQELNNKLLMKSEDPYDIIERYTVDNV